MRLDLPTAASQMGGTYTYWLVLYALSCCTPGRIIVCAILEMILHCDADLDFAAFTESENVS